MSFPDSVRRSAPSANVTEPGDRRVQPGERPQQRRLPATVRADQRGDCPGVQREGGRTHDDVAAVGDVDLMDMHAGFDVAGDEGHRRTTRSAYLGYRWRRHDSDFVPTRGESYRVANRTMFRITISAAAVSQ